MIAIAAPRIFDGERFTQGGVVLIEDGRIAAFDEEVPENVAVRRLPDGTLLAPGYVDLQVNGGGGVLLNDDVTAATMGAIAAAHASCGTTTLLPTLISGTRAMIAAALDAARADIPGVVGLHVEGPFINPDRRGIHPLSNIATLGADDVDRFCAHGRPLMVTLAPERTDPALIERLRDAGIVVFAGHSDATAEQAVGGFAAGVSGCTHLFNAMSQYGSRAPGMVGAALACATMAGLICDGLHVHPISVRAAWRALGPDRLFLVSDAMPTAASSIGHFTWQGEVIALQGGRLAKADGMLAGAHITMAECVANAVSLCGLPVQDALRMATLTPATAMRLTGIGRIAIGVRADLIALDPSLHVTAVWQGGEEIPTRS